MGILFWIASGLVVGIAVKWIMPGRDRGVLVRIVLGILGAMVGGLVGVAAGFGGLSGFNVRSLFIAVGGALLVLTGYRLVMNGVTV